MRLNTVVMGTRAHEENLAQLEAAAGGSTCRAFTGSSSTPGSSSPSRPAATRARDGHDYQHGLHLGQGEAFRARMDPSVLADLVPLRRALDAGSTVGAGSDWGPKQPSDTSSWR